MVSLDIEEDALSGLPPLATLRALEEQNTDELRIKARRFAELRVRYVRGVGQPIPKDYATELVDDAITNTWLGLARWDLQRCPLLLDHVCNTIRDRTSKEIRHGLRFPHIPIHIVANDSSDAGQVKHALELDGTSSPITLVRLVFYVASELKMFASSDENAQAILDCWQAGIVDRDDVISLTGLSPAAYTASRRRLLSLSKRLPAELRESANELLRSVS